MGVWCCFKLDPEDEKEQRQEPSAEDGSLFAFDFEAERAKGKGKGVRDTVANSIVPGPGLVCQKNVGWVNALAFDLWKLSRGKPDYFYCRWVGSNRKYYEHAIDKRRIYP